MLLDDYTNTKRFHAGESTFTKKEVRKKPEGTLMKSLDFITRPLYASAGFSNAMVQGKGINQALSSASKGLAGQERVFYSEVLQNAGVKNKYTRAVAGFALDVALDPITYLTFGVGVGAKLGLKTLSKPGQSFLNQSLKANLSNFTKLNIAEGMTKNVAERTAREMIEEGVLKTALKNPEKYVSESAIKFLGKRVPIASDAWKYAGKKISPITEQFHKVGPVRWTGEHFIGESYKIKHMKGTTPLEKNLQILYNQQYKTAKSLGDELAIQGSLKMARETPIMKDRELIANAWEQTQKRKVELSTLLPEHLVKPAIKLSKFLDNEVYGPEIRQGLLKDYKKSGVHIPHFYEKHLRRESQNIPHPIVARNRHGRVRIFETMEEASKKGWQPIEDYAVSVGLRNAYSKKIIAVDDYVQKTLSNVATPLTKNSDAWKSMVKNKKVPEGMGLYISRNNARFYPLHNATKSKEVQIQTSKAMKTLQNKEGKQFFQGGELLEQLKLTPVEKTFKISDNIHAYLLPKEMADIMNSVSPYLTTSEGTKGMTKLFDDTLNLWKTSVTVWFPGFHARNAMSNLWLCFLGGVKNPLKFKEAFQLQKYDSLVSKGKVPKDFTIKLYDKNYKVSELVKMSKETGVLSKGWFGGEMGGTIKEQILRQVGKAGKTKEKLTTKGVARKALEFPTEKGRAIGNAVENNARIALLLDQLNKGIDINSAARHTKKFLFDYQDLTEFEKTYMKRLLPFYTWSRKNIPLEVEQIMAQPGKFSMMNKVKEEVESVSKEPKEKYLPDWMREREMFVRLPYESPDKPLYMNFDFAFQDLARLSGNPAVLKGWLAGLSPHFKIPFEVAMNHNMYFGRELVDKNLPDEIKYRKALKESLINNLRITGWAAKLTDEEQSLTERLLDGILGLKAYPFDERKQKYYSEQRQKREEKALRKLEKEKRK